MEDEIEQLKKQVAELSAKVNSFLSNQTLPVEFESALLDKGFIRFVEPTTPILNGDTVLFQSNGQGFRIDSGSGVQVPAIPYRYLVLPKNVSGQSGDMYIPLYIFADTTSD